MSAGRTRALGAHTSQETRTAPKQGLELGAGLTSHQQRPAAPAPPGKTAPHSPNEHPERTPARAPPGGLPRWSSAASQPMKEKENLEVMKRPRGRTNSLPPQLVPTLYRARPGGREVTSAAPRGPQPPVPAAKPPGTAPWPFLLSSACLERNASPGSWQHRLEYKDAFVWGSKLLCVRTSGSGTLKRPPGLAGAVQNLCGKGTHRHGAARGPGHGRQRGRTGGARGAKVSRRPPSGRPRAGGRQREPLGTRRRVKVLEGAR